MKAFRNLMMALGLLAVSTSVHAQQPVTFKDQRVTVLVGHAAGGGTDRFARVLGNNLAEKLPGKPTIVVQNMPGADGIIALNAFATRIKPDGLTLTVGSQAQVDPLNYRKKTATYDPTRFEYIGGAARAGTAVLINKEALPRIRDRGAAPVTVGALAAVRSGMQVILWGGEFLDWNVRWVLGYRTTADLNLALERGEVDMTSIPVISDVLKMLDTGKFSILVQAGAFKGGKLEPVKEFSGAPLISDLLAGKLNDPVAQNAFSYWINNASVGQWVALPEGTPKHIVQAHREAFEASMRMEDMMTVTRLLNGEIFQSNGEETAAMVASLAKTSPEALAFIVEMGRRQGLVIE